MDLVQLIIGAVYAGLVILALWPRYGTGRRFLRRWGIAEPDDEQVAVAVRYLRRRRLPIVPLMLVLPLAKTAVGVRPAGDDPLNPFTLLASLLVALLLAESLAGLRRPGAVRTAPLVQRSVRDLLPRYAVWLHAMLTAVVAGVALAGLAVQPAVDRALDRLPPNESRPDGSGLVLLDELRAELADPIGWPIVLGAALVAVVAFAVAWRATARPADPDQRIDLVLRVRSARVAVGTGIALTGALGVAAVERMGHIGDLLRGAPTAGPPFGSYPAGGPAFPADAIAATEPGWLDVWASISPLLGLVVLLTGLLGWVWVANPPLRSPVPSRP